MKNLINKLLSKLAKIVVDNQKRKNVLAIVVFVMFVIISTIFTITNAATGNIFLMYITLGFLGLTLINIGIFLINKKYTRFIAMLLFTLEVTAMFLTFLITGIPEGFSVIWIAMVPSFGLLFYGMLLGSIYSATMFLTLVFFFYIPFGQSLLQYQYTAEFMLRFPLLYLAFFGVAFFIEIIRTATHNELVKTQKEYEFLYSHDALTGIYNRYGFKNQINEFLESDTNTLGFAILDMDFFKKVNDKYGHLNGDTVIKESSQLLVDTVGDKGVVCRWGGEEFLVTVRDATEAPVLFNLIHKTIKEHKYFLDGVECHITISLGGVIVHNLSSVSSLSLIKQADNNLYKAKINGRDQVIITDYEI